MFDYEAWVERDHEGIRRSVGRYLQSSTPDDLFLQVARFAVMAFAPTQHSRAALLSCLAARDVRDYAGEEWIRILTECAIYAADARLPWSEPPILDPPDVSGDPPATIDRLRSLVGASDRLAAERWLAKRLADPTLSRDLLMLAAEDLTEFGASLVIANAAVRLSELLGKRGRYAVLRVAIVELCSRKSPDGVPPATMSPEPAADPADLRARVAAHVIGEGGSIDAMHWLFFYDAAVQSGQEARAARVIDSLEAGVDGDPDAEKTGLEEETPLEAYRLARDFGSYLRAFPIARRWNDPRIVMAARRNLRHGLSFEEWSFA